MATTMATRVILLHHWEDRVAPNMVTVERLPITAALAVKATLEPVVAPKPSQLTPTNVAQPTVTTNASVVFAAPRLAGAEIPRITVGLAVNRASVIALPRLAA